MKILNNVCVCVVAGIMLSSCIGNSKFTEIEKSLSEPYREPKTFVYFCDQGYTDTISFAKIKIDTVKFRDWERGFYNQNQLSIKYKLSKGSFHKLKEQEEELLILFIETRNEGNSREFSFLGLLFNGDYLDTINVIDGKNINFNQQNARYDGSGVNEKIQSFQFNAKDGIISFVDKNEVIWNRKQIYP